MPGENAPAEPTQLGEAAESASSGAGRELSNASMRLFGTDSQRRGPVKSMSDISGTPSDDPAPEADTDESTVRCPACDSTNTIQIAARGLQHHCRDCNNAFDPSAGPIRFDLR
jgi:hypothetical protein